MATQCIGPECSRMSTANGLCLAHYKQKKKGKELKKIRSKAKNNEMQGKICKVKECPNIVYAKFICKNHYEKVRRRKRYNA